MDPNDIPLNHKSDSVVFSSNQSNKTTMDNMENYGESILDPITNSSRHNLHSNAIKNCLQNLLTRKLLLKLKDQVNTLEKRKGTLWYLLKCKEKQFFPKTLKVQQEHLTNLDKTLSFEWKKIENKASIQLLNVAIKDAKIKIEELEKLHQQKLRELLDLLPDEDATEINKHLEDVAKKAQKATITAQTEKLKFQQNKKTNHTQKEEGNLPPSKEEDNLTPPKKSHNRRFLPKAEYERRKKQQKQQQIILFKNFSSFNFDEHTEKLVQRGATFVPLPSHVNTTEINSHINRFQRSCYWKAYWAAQENSGDFQPSVVYKPKCNLPSTSPPKPLEDALTGIRTEILSSPLNKVHDNITQGEKKAMSNLVELRQNGTIVIQPLDKTGGLAVFDRQDYVDGLRKVLNEKYTTNSGEENNFYEKVTQRALADGLQNIKEVIESGVQLEILTKEEAIAMVPDEPKPGRLYGLAKDHKEYENIPPFRPIVSGSGSLTENISKYVDFHAKPLVPALPSFIEDTPDLLRALENLKVEEIPQNAIPVTIDVVGLYSNIPQDEAELAVQQALRTRSDSEREKVPTEFLIDLLHLVLKLNIFTFDGDLFRQLWGIAMGTRCAPTVANLFMGLLEAKILDSPFVDKIYKKFWRRFIDDILLIWIGSEAELKEFLDFINTLHPTIKFTASYDFNEAKADFLDTTIYIQNGKITTDLYRKPTHSPQYLLPSSTHPPHCVKNIPFSLAYRLRRICSEDETFEKRLLELKEMLRERCYKENIIDEAFKRARLIPRQEAIKRVTFDRTTKKVTFVIPFDPRLPKISFIVKKHFELMKKDSQCAEIFKDGVQVAYKRHKNIRDILCRATLPPLRLRSGNRTEKGWKACAKVCRTCAHSYNIQEFVVTATGEKIQIQQKITCTDKNVIYCIECIKCNQQYVGKTSMQFKTRANQHRRSVEIALSEKKKGATDHNITPVALHFSQKNHSQNDMFFFAFEKVINSDPFVIGARERFYIDKMQVVEKGINRNRT